MLLNLLSQVSPLRYQLWIWEKNPGETGLGAGWFCQPLPYPPPLHAGCSHPLPGLRIDHCLLVKVQCSFLILQEGQAHRVE